MLLPSILGAISSLTISSTRPRTVLSICRPISGWVISRPRKKTETLTLRALVTLTREMQRALEEEIANRDDLATFRDWIPFLLDSDRAPRVP